MTGKRIPFEKDLIKKAWVPFDPPVTLRPKPPSQTAPIPIAPPPPIVDSKKQVIRAALGRDGLAASCSRIAISNLDFDELACKLEGLNPPE